MSHETVRRYDDDEPRKETSIVDQLFLELSQFTQAVTAQESRLLDERNILLGELGKAKTERDALRTQARELADMLKEYLEGSVVCRSYVENVWQCIHCDAMNEPSGEFEHADDCETVKTKSVLQKARAVLDTTKEGR